MKFYLNWVVVKIIDNLWAKNLGIVKMFRGDSLELLLDIRKNSHMVEEKYNITELDTIYFALMEVNQKFENAILKKTYSIGDVEDGNIIIKLNSNDTVNLLSGKYYFTIKMKHDLENYAYDVYTLLKNTEFWILD